MALSFRQIGSRLKLQGGGSSSNVFIGNKLATGQPIIVSGNYTLIQNIVKQIRARIDLINTILLPVETLVKAQPLDIFYLVSLINPEVIVLLLKYTSSFSSDIFTLYTSLFYTTIKAKFETPDVLINLANRLTPFAGSVIAVYADLSTYIRNAFIQYLSNNKLKLKEFSERFIPFLLEYRFAIDIFIIRYTEILKNRILPITTPSAAFNFDILPNQLKSEIYISLCKIIVPSKSTSTFIMYTTEFNNNVPFVFTSVVFNLQNAKLNIVKTLFESLGGANNISVSFNEALTNSSDVPWVIDVCAFFKMGGGYVTANGLMSVMNSPL